jgi:glycerol-3-phosphate acyltransferase PlsX
VVTDGFTGNVALKTLEGGMNALVGALFTAFGSSPEAEEGARLLGPALEPMYREFHPDTYGGAMLLGVRGVCMISHGSSNAWAMENAIRTAADMVRAEVVAALTEAVAEPEPAPPGAD